MKNNPQDDFELPEDVAPDPVLETQPELEVRVIAEDLHLGAPVVTGFKTTWLDQHGPKPPGPGILALDSIIILMLLGYLILFFNIWVWIATA